MRVSQLSITVVVAIALLVAGCGSSGSTASVNSSNRSTSGHCTPAHHFSTVSKGYLTVSVADLPPYAEVKGNTLAGVDGDIVTDIAKMECLTVKPLVVSSAGAITAVQDGRADTTIGDWYRTAARAKIVTQSDPIYTNPMAVVSKSGVDSVAALKGQTIGTVTGFPWDADLQKLYGSNVKFYQSEQALFADLVAGRLDVATGGVPDSKINLALVHGPLSTYKVKVLAPTSQIEATVEPGEANLPTSKKNSALSVAINADIAKLRSSGELAKILEKYGMPGSAANVPKKQYLS